MKSQTDKFTASLESKSFENDGEHIFISRVYASFDPPPQSDDIKLVKIIEGSFSGHLPKIAEKNLAAFEEKYFYTSTERTTKPLWDKKYSELKIRETRIQSKYSIERSLSEIQEYNELSEEEKIKKYSPNGLGFHYDHSGFNEEEEEKKWDELRKYNASISPNFLISDEIRIKITPENLDKYLTISKQKLEGLDKQQIADWYLYEKSEILSADTKQKQETAIRKRRTDILKFLPLDKPIKDLIGKTAFKEGKKNLSERIKKKKELDRGPKIPVKVDFVSIFFWGIFLLILFWFALKDLEGPKSTCDKAFEYHKDFQVLEQCRRNSLINDMYDN
ncbi:hypothetical protein N9D45_05650 [Gammaproteobacteria bacterium]|nr:hypothetical protein [Gammaproteobacteria bacterium]